MHSYLVNLSLYFLVVAAVIVLPGMDMAFIVAAALAWGRGAGFRAIAGVVTGGIVHMLMAASGIIVVTSLYPWTMRAFLCGGALYMLWLGVSLQFTRAGGTSLQRPLARRPFRGAVLTCLINPKAYIFTLALLPQFIKPEFGPLSIQVIPLAVIAAFLQVLVYGAAVLGALRVRGWIDGGSGGLVPLEKLVGGLLIAAAVVVLWQTFSSI